MRQLENKEFLVIQSVERKRKRKVKEHGYEMLGYDLCL